MPRSMARVMEGSVMPTTRRLFTWGWTVVFLAHDALTLGMNIVGEAANPAPTNTAPFRNFLLVIVAMSASP